MWSYSGDPATSELDQVRFYVQDTDEARPLLQDEEIEFLLTQWAASFGSPLYTAAVAAEIIAAKFAAQITVSADGVSVDQGSLQQKYNDLATSLRDQYKALYSMEPPDLSSIMDSGVDWSITPLSFGVGFQDNYWAGSQEYGNLRGPGHSVVSEYPEQTW